MNEITLNLNSSEMTALVNAANKADMNIHKFLRSMIKGLNK